MKALLFDGGARIVEQPIPRPAAHEALIRVTTAGICNTDLEIRKGYMGFKGVPGHEFVGVVESAEDPSWIGKRVVGEINCIPPDCNCSFCRLELPHHCSNRTVLGILNRDGAFAEYLTLPVANLHAVVDDIPDDVAVFTEPLAAAFRILEQIDVAPEDRVVVLGDGKLGQLIAQVLHRETRNVVCVGRNRWKLELLKDLQISTAYIDDPLEPLGADIVVEATGSYEGFTRALELVRPEGTVILKTTVSHPTAFDLSLPVINEIRIIGSRCGPFRPALEALRRGEIVVEPMISESHPLLKAPEALQRAAERDVLKVLMRTDLSSF